MREHVAVAVENVVHDLESQADVARASGRPVFFLTFDAAPRALLAQLKPGGRVLVDGVGSGDLAAEGDVNLSQERRAFEASAAAVRELVSKLPG